MQMRCIQPLGFLRQPHYANASANPSNRSSVALAPLSFALGTSKALMQRPFSPAWSWFNAFTTTNLLEVQIHNRIVS